MVPTCTTSSSLVGHQRRDRCPGHLHHPRDLVLLDVDRYVSHLQQVDQALDMLAEYVPADVVGVVVGGQHAGQL